MSDRDSKSEYSLQMGVNQKVTEFLKLAEELMVDPGLLCMPGELVDKLVHTLVNLQVKRFIAQSLLPLFANLPRSSSSWSVPSNPPLGFNVGIPEALLADFGSSSSSSSHPSSLGSVVNSAGVANLASSSVPFETNFSSTSDASMSAGRTSGFSSDKQEGEKATRKRRVDKSGDKEQAAAAKPKRKKSKTKTNPELLPLASSSTASLFFSPSPSLPSPFAQPQFVPPGGPSQAIRSRPRAGYRPLLPLPPSPFTQQPKSTRVPQGALRVPHGMTSIFPSSAPPQTTFSLDLPPMSPFPVELEELSPEAAAAAVATDNQERQEFGK